MSTEAASRLTPLSRFEQIRLAREILRTEGQALLSLSERLGDDFCRAVDVLFHCHGSVIVSGMGKAGLVGQKIAATLASTGTRSHFLHPGEAIHGDLGRVHHDDAVLMLSFSGETDEVTRLLPSLRAIPLVAITGKPHSTLGRQAAVTLDLGPIREACTLGLAPSTSTTAMLALGDALALVLSRMRSFGALDFVRFHPGGSLGRKLSKVDDLMRPLEECRVAREDKTVRDVFVDVSRPGRRTGAIMLTDEHGLLTGIFTDSDLARLLETRRDRYIDGPVRDVMTHRPRTVRSGSAMGDALEVLAERKISELPVIDADGRPRGLLDITDVVGLLPRDVSAAEATGTMRANETDAPATVPLVGRD
ncbi:MAG: KpsF/GutQ family sugar-phosphate isomerase [Pirellulaceae bacterium]|jgi:arabinose-5-phosphate isomerase|nr:KpsF/GutQ family sugar-phosphate isomerase [Pirellulaceae bacterium]